MNLYLVRHGYALHNLLFKKIGKEAYNIRDTQLLQKGIDQAVKLGNEWKEDIGLVVCSPSIRTLDTALLIFGDREIIALDTILEYPQGNEECNRRKDISVLKILYPQVDFSYLSGEKIQWNYKKESIKELNDRRDVFIEWVKVRDEKNICVVSHSSFIGNLKDGTMGDAEHELEHCFPYKFSL